MCLSVCVCLCFSFLIFVVQILQARRWGASCLKVSNVNWATLALSCIPPSFSVLPAVDFGLSVYVWVSWSVDPLGG